MSILLIATHRNGFLSSETARVLSAAYRIAPEVDILIAGKDAREAAECAAQLKNVRNVLLAESEVFLNSLAEPLADLIVSLAGSYDTIIANSCSEGKNIMPRVSALLGVMQVSGIIEVVSFNSFRRLIYSGSAVQTVKTLDSTRVITVRVSSFDAIPKACSRAPIKTVEVPALSCLSRFISRNFDNKGNRDLSSAKIIISGGRSLGSAENFQKLLFPLAEKLGAAVGASRAAVDAGYAPNDLQIGQTGRVVSPDLYIACGISGAIQHIIGMQDSKTIVAINNDTDAPIFNNADYGLVGDLFEILPALYEAL